MFSESFLPRFSDTDALGHINNTMVPIWFEGARTPVFKIFTPELNLSSWPLILAKIDVAFEAQMFYGHAMEVRTYIGRVGGSSFDVFQELWQQGQRVASGTAVMVCFDYNAQKSVPISESLREELAGHLYPGDS
ncbi:acyl-CoA thioesterase [Thalassotalea sp. M1531]|uniref:Acyl-CoA thioesterase n=1 Tax=Thalassotalea algicola TaxID=2716224 RepID=A0A7Y0LB00_9GAMM|nr:thioesterase family protein [Thalassotalea algicola]NMP30361.1 acyl-CoA thioesterase [Thalassotalea algicola]